MGCKILILKLSKIRKAAVLILLSGLLACDPGEDIPVKQVDSADTLTELELHDLSQQAHDPSHSHQTVYYFGFDLRASPQEDTAQYLPFLKYLENATGYIFRLHFTPRNSSAADELGQNRAQFSAMGATSFLYARQKYGARSLVRGVNHMGRAEYQSMLVAAPDSPVRSIRDITGRKLAFGSKDSTQGHLIPRIMLLEHSIPLSHLGSYIYTGSHQNCAEAVVSGNYDVCGMQDQLAKSLAEQGLLKIIHASGYYPSSGIAVNASVPEEAVERVLKALLEFDPQGAHRQAMYNWDKTEMPRGFVAANSNDYTELRKWSIRLGFLEDDGQQETPR